jgi:hypothetical protein
MNRWWYYSCWRLRYTHSLWQRTMHSVLRFFIYFTYLLQPFTKGCDSRNKCVAILDDFLYGEYSFLCRQIGQGRNLHCHVQKVWGNAYAHCYYHSLGFKMVCLKDWGWLENKLIFAQRKVRKQCVVKSESGEWYWVLSGFALCVHSQPWCLYSPVRVFLNQQLSW